MQVFGYLEWFGLKLNGVSVVNIVMAVGVSVEFTAHIARAFMIASGSRRERASEAVLALGFPVLAGGFSTFLGVVAMAFAFFPYFRLYFFGMYCLIITSGLINGLLLMPVRMSPVIVAYNNNKN